MHESCYTYCIHIKLVGLFRVNEAKCIYPEEHPNATVWCRPDSKILLLSGQVTANNAESCTGQTFNTHLSK